MYILSYSTTVVLGYGVIILHCFSSSSTPLVLKSVPGDQVIIRGPRWLSHPCRAAVLRTVRGQRGLPGSWKPAEDTQTGRSPADTPGFLCCHVPATREPL